MPRSRVDVLDIDTPLTEVRDRMSTGHSRYPVLDADDHVLGTVDLLDVLAAAETDEALPSLLRRPVFVPESLTLPDAVAALLEHREQMACVVDEYGGFAGILTMEDLGEELVGDIADEHDHAIEELIDDGDGTWTAPGIIPLDEVARAIQRELPATSAQTLSGLVIEHAKGFPAVGDRVMIELPLDPADLAGADTPEPERLVIDVLEVATHVPSALRIGIEVAR